MQSHTDSAPSTLLPPPRALRERLARALREVDILRGLLRLAEGVARRDGEPARVPTLSAAWQKDGDHVG